MLLYDMKKNEGKISAESAEQYLVELFVITNSLTKYFKEEMKLTDSQLEEVISQIGKKHGLYLDNSIAKISKNIEIKALDRLLERGEGIEYI